MLIPFLNMNVCATPHAPRPTPHRRCNYMYTIWCLSLSTYWYNQETMQYVYQNTLITAVLLYFTKAVLLYFTKAYPILVRRPCPLWVHSQWDVLTCSDHFPIRLGPLCVVLCL